GEGGRGRGLGAGRPGVARAGSRRAGAPTPALPRKRGRGPRSTPHAWEGAPGVLHMHGRAPAPHRHGRGARECSTCRKGSQKCCTCTEGSEKCSTCMEGILGVLHMERGAQEWTTCMGALRGGPRAGEEWPLRCRTCTEGVALARPPSGNLPLQ